MQSALYNDKCASLPWRETRQGRTVQKEVYYMNKYEVMYVIDTALDDQARTDVINRFSGLVEANGEIIDKQ